MVNRIDTMTNKAMGGASVFANADDQTSANAMLITAAYEYSDHHSTKVGAGGQPLTAGTAPTSMGDPLELGSGLSGPSTGGTITAAAGMGVARATNQTSNAPEPLGRLSTQGMDALEVDFDISATRPLSSPYVVTISRYRTPNEMAGSYHNLVYARAIDPVDSKRFSHVHFSEDGFPFNYEMVEFQLHVFDRGIEIATNLSAHRVELTRDEAFEYVKIEYMESHRASTLPAAPAMGQLPADLPARLAAGDYSRTFYVRVSKEGIPLGAYSDSAGKKMIDDAYLAALLTRVRFKPGLNLGKPVESVVPLNLNKLTI
jgi:hypothetical protein